jgi:hypothetical protein
VLLQTYPKQHDDWDENTWFESLDQNIGQGLKYGIGDKE